jgi:hypothetical protein
MRASALSLSLAVLGSVALSSTVAHAQLVELPRSIPGAKVSQQVGLTEIGVDYDCPAAKGRKIWGGVVPFGQVWVMGANVATRIKFSKDVTIGDRTVPAGSYWLLATPNKDSWTLAINKSPDPVASARDYKPELDVARVKVTPKSTTRRERLTYTFSDLTDDRASLDLEWDALRVSLPIQVNTTQQVQAAINGLDNTWRSYTNAARYMLETKKDYDAGLRYIDQALALRDDWYSMWVKGSLLAAKGDFGSAREWAEKAHTLALQVGNAGGLEPELKKSIAEWGRRSGRSEKEAVAMPNLPKMDPKMGPKPDGDDVAVKNVQPPSTTTPPAFKSASDTDTVPGTPAGDPPVMRRARLRHH